jgi:hypothetical protein
LEVALLFQFICGVISAVIASKNGRSGLFGLFVGLGLGPLGIGLVLVMGSGTKAAPKPDQERHRRMLEKFHSQRQDEEQNQPRSVPAVSRKTKASLIAVELVLLLAIMLTIMMYLSPPDFSKRSSGSSSGSSEKLEQPPTPMSESDRRFTECVGKFRGVGRCFEEENLREQRIEEKAEAIRRSRRR